MKSNQIKIKVRIVRGVYRQSIVGLFHTDRLLGIKHHQTKRQRLWGDILSVVMHRIFRKQLEKMKIVYRRQCVPMSVLIMLILLIE